MIKRQLFDFALRWVFSSFGLWISITLFAEVKGEITWWMYIMAGFVFSILNAFFHPIIKTFAIPLILVTMGLFTVIINAAMVTIAIRVIPNISIDFWGAVFSSIVMSIANGLVNFWPSPYNRR